MKAVSIKSKISQRKKWTVKTEESQQEKLVANDELAHQE